MDIIMSHVANVTGLNLRDIRLTDLNYADDAALLTDDSSQLQPALQCLEEEASKFGLHVSWAKTKVQNLGSGHAATPITVNGEVVEAVNSFVYLGSTMSSGSNSHSEVMRRIGLAASVIDRLSRIWSQRHLSLRPGPRWESLHCAPHTP